MKTAYDNPNFARRIYKYKACPLNMTLFKRVLLPDWSVFERVTVKIKKIGKNGNIGKSNTQKKKGYTEDETEKDFLDSKLTKDKTIANDGAIVMDYDEMNEAVASLPPLPTTENIMKHDTLNNDKEPEENNEVVLTTNIKDVDEREVVTGDMEAFEPDAEGNDLLEFNTDMVLESIDAQGGEAKGLLDGEFTELIPDKGGGNEKTVRECLKT